MAITKGSAAIWDVEPTLRRMEAGHYHRYIDTYRRVAVMGNALAGIPLRTLYMDPARTVLAAVRANLARAGMISDKLLNATEQQASLVALQALDAALANEAPDLNLYRLCTQPGGQFPALIPLFTALDAASPHLCVPFVQPGFDPAIARPALDALLALIGDSRTLADLYDRAPSLDWGADFNRVMVGARRAGLLIELRGLRKPAAPGYVNDPADDRWDVRSCVAPENAVLFKEVHQRINTMAYLMMGLTYGDFFDLPMVDEKVLPHFRRRVAAEPGYWFSALEKERIVAALDDMIVFLQGSPDRGLTLREVYTRPDVPAEVLRGFQRILDVKPEICLPFMNYDWDYTEAAAAIDPFLRLNGGRTLKQLYVESTYPVKETYTQSEFELLLQQRAATKTLLRKTNNLVCYNPGECGFEFNEYCSTTPITGNCQP